MYFMTLINWVASMFTRMLNKEVRGLDWNGLYKTYHAWPMIHWR
jgi:hypothetical protein